VDQDLYPARPPKPAFAKIPHAVTLDWTISDGAFRLYALLVRLSWKTQEARVDQDRLGEYLHRSDDTVRARLRELEDVGLISRTRRGHGLSDIIEMLDPSEVYSRDALRGHLPEKLG
jgi:hypothetical protein